MKTCDVTIPPIVEEKIRNQVFRMAADKPSAAIKWRALAFKKIMSLAAFPEQCSEVPESQYVRYCLRHLLIGEYRVLFRVKDLKVLVLDFKSSKQNRPY